MMMDLNKGRSLVWYKKVVGIPGILFSPYFAGQMGWERWRYQCARYSIG